MTQLRQKRTNLTILGGGLAGGLVALFLAERRPELAVTLTDSAPRFGGNHVWSFFSSDIEEVDRTVLDPLVTASWEGYDVHFPNHSRRLSTPYRTITGERLDARLREVLPESARITGAHVTSASTEEVRLDDGRTIAADAVLDTRGTTGLAHMAGGWQTFLGRHLRLCAPHGLARPVVMDARVDQVNGYRFVYCLPFSATEVFVEDTYYADTPAIDREALAARIDAYAHAQGWQVSDVAYEESGALPVIATGNFDAFWKATNEDVARAGTRAALVHPLTSYSLPDAVRFASHLCALDNLSGQRLLRISHDWAATHWRRRRFYRMLSRMLFGASRPDQRWRMLERFYRLPEPLIERFYKGASSVADMGRVLAGKPPVPVGAAIASLAGRGRPLASLDPAHTSLSGSHAA